MLENDVKIKSHASRRNMDVIHIWINGKDFSYLSPNDWKESNKGEVVKAYFMGLMDMAKYLEVQSIEVPGDPILYAESHSIG
jgi:hypothetical protein